MRLFRHGSTYYARLRHGHGSADKADKSPGLQALTVWHGGGGELDYKGQQSKEQEKLWSPMEGKQARGREQQESGRHHLSQELQERRASQEQARKAPRGYLLWRKTGHAI